jgi:peptidoglycan hydrolase CwlO-like protein
VTADQQDTQALESKIEDLQSDLDEAISDCDGMKSCLSDMECERDELQRDVEELEMVIPDALRNILVRSGSMSHNEAADLTVAALCVWLEDLIAGV